MSVLKRPLFRQAGGPAQPMPQDMMPPGPPPAPPGPPPEQMAMLEQAQAQGMMQGERMGAQYAQAMMQNLDNAEDAEGVINAIRGNQKPLESRRMELASFVGSDDANATPESVLAMVQPVIMMTEQGAMDSGIGELMQGLVGDVDMQASGMDEGVGSLMMAGAPEAPAPQNFNQGGAVRSFNRGGGAFSGYSPTVNYRNPKANGMMPLLSDETSAIAEEFGSEALMAMAGRGQGVEKRGQGAENSSQGSTEALPKSKSLRNYYDEMLPLYKELLGDTEEQRNYNKAQTYFDIAQAGLNLASGVDPRTGKSTAGQPLGSQIASAASQLGPSIQARAAEDRQFERQIKSGALQAASDLYSDEQAAKQAALADFRKYRYDLGVEDVRQGGRLELAGYQGAIQAGLERLKAALDDDDLYGSGETGQARGRLAQPETVENLTRGLLFGETDDAARLAVSDLSTLMKANPITGEVGPLPPELQEFGRLISDPVYRQEIQDQINADTKASDALIERISKGQPRSSTEFAEHIDILMKDAYSVDLEAGTGYLSGPANLLEYNLQQLRDAFDFSINGSVISDAPEARRLLDTAFQLVDRYVTTEPGSNRWLAGQYDTLVKNMPSTSMFETDSNALARIENFSSMLKEDIRRYQDQIDNGRLHKDTTIDLARQRMFKAKHVSQLLDVMASNYRSGPSGSRIGAQEQRLDFSRFYSSPTGS